MSRKARGLTARFVETIAAPGMHADGGGLYLAVGSRSSKSWIFRYAFGGRRREMGLGSVERLCLAAARAKASDMRASLGRGIDPLTVPDEPEKTPPFGEFADAYVKTMRQSSMP